MYGFRTLAFATFLFLSGCATGIHEFEAYSTAYNLQHNEAQQVLNKLAKDERKIWELENDSARTPRFFANNAAYYVEAGDPPLTGSIRETLDGVLRFNQALVALGNGSRSEVVSDQIVGAVTNLGQASVGFSGVLSSVSGAGALNAFGPAITNVSNKLNPLVPVLQSGLTISARSEMREILVSSYPTLRKILIELRPTAEAIYNVYLAENLSSDTPRSEQIRDRQLIAGWVLLIDETIKAMDVAIVAVQNPRSSVGVAQLGEATTRLRILSETLRVTREQ